MISVFHSGICFGLDKMGCKNFKVNKFILVSTDKAVNPTNVMGASKHLAEVICRGLQLRSKTDFVIAGENMGPSKLEKANQLKITIISEIDFKNMIDG